MLHLNRFEHYKTVRKFVYCRKFQPGICVIRRSEISGRLSVCNYVIVKTGNLGQRNFIKRFQNFLF